MSICCANLGLRDCALMRLLPALFVVVLACAEEELPDPATVQLAALSAASVVDTLEDLGAVSEPEAPGVRDAFRAAALRALEHAQAAHGTAPSHTLHAHDQSVEAADVVDQFGEAFALALEATGQLATLEAGVADARRCEELAAVDDLMSPRLFRGAAAIMRKFASSNPSNPGTGRARGDLLRARQFEQQAAIVESCEALDAWPEDLGSYVTTLVFEVGSFRTVTADKIKAAEDQRDDAISAYRRAAEAWRNLGHR